ncbi:hypothetical protein GCM10010214_32210 [Streptomyces abikoensis]|nr:hypothetical protein GCM10010214_32210 [Streptomyces abikoensis]
MGMRPNLGPAPVPPPRPNGHSGPATCGAPKGRGELRDQPRRTRRRIADLASASATASAAATAPM